MDEPIETVETGVIKANLTSSDVISWEETSLSMQKKSVEYSLERRKSLKARYIYGFVFLLTNLMAWLIRDYGHQALSEMHYLKACGNEGQDCSHIMGVLRVSLGCFIFFLLMLLTTFKTSKLHGAGNTWHSRWWSLKFVLLVISVAVPFFFPLSFIQFYGEISRIGAGIFLLLQLISVIEFITWWNNYWMSEEELKQCGSLGLFTSTIFYIASICGIVLMYMLYAPRLLCSLNIFFISWTAILLIVMMVISLHSKVNRGLLSSGIMASYIVFLCWSAIRSEPVIEKCSPQKEAAGNGHWTTVLGFLIAICSIVMATFSTGIDSQSFQFRKDKVQEEDDVPYDYGFFHFVFAMGAMYFAMLFISWNLDHSTKKWSIDVGWASTWVKIINEWIAASIYLWKLISPVVRQAKVMDQEGQIHYTASP